MVYVCGEEWGVGGCVCVGGGVVYKMLDARRCDLLSVSGELIGLSPAQLFLEYGLKLVRHETKRQHTVYINERFGTNEHSKL